MKTRKVISYIFLGVLISVLSLGCTLDKADPKGENEIWLHDTEFKPRQKTISAGTTVKWTNKDDYTHIVTDGEGRFGKAVQKGESFTYRYDSVGTYKFNCTHHSGMKGKIIVQ